MIFFLQSKMKRGIKASEVEVAKIAASLALLAMTLKHLRAHSSTG